MSVKDLERGGVDMYGDRKKFYKVGTGWVLDIENYIGYHVRREEVKGKKTGRILGFDKAFSASIQKDKDDVQMEVYIETPAGTLIKAKELIINNERGLLKPRVRQYK